MGTYKIAWKPLKLKDDKEVRYEMDEYDSLEEAEARLKVLKSAWGVRHVKHWIEGVNGEKV